MTLTPKLTDEQCDFLSATEEHKQLCATLDAKYPTPQHQDYPDAYWEEYNKAWNALALKYYPDAELD